jgi:peroxiredoxin
MTHSELKYFSYLIISLFLVACQATGIQKGNTAPDFTLKNTKNQNIQLSKLKGKVVLIHFWNDKCKSCRAEFPKIQALYEDLQGEDFELLAVNIGQKEKISLDFEREFQATFPMLIDNQAITRDVYRVETYPTNFFINPEGKIIRRTTGWVNKRQVEVIIQQNKHKDKKNN